MKTSPHLPEVMRLAKERNLEVIGRPGGRLSIRDEHGTDLLGERGVTARMALALLRFPGKFRGTATY